MLLAALLLAIAAYQSQPGVSRDSRPPAAQSTISGRVTARDSGQPLPRIVVTLVSPDGLNGARAVTDADGRYHFIDVKPGKYVLSAGPDEHRSTYLRQRFGDTDPSPTFNPPPPNIEVAAGEQKSGLDLALWRALAIEGRVIDPLDRPMARVHVGVTRADGEPLPVYPAISDDLGQYRAYGLAPGRYRVCASLQGEVDESTPQPTRLARTCHPAALIEDDASDVLLTSVDVSGIDIRVQRTGGHSVAGMVFDAGGTRVDDARVDAYPLDGGEGSASAITRGGEFVLRGLAPSRYVVRASLGETHAGDPEPKREAEVGYTPVDVRAGDVVGIGVALSKGVSITGRVRFEGSEAPARRLQMVIQGRTAFELYSMRDRAGLGAVRDDLTFELKPLFRFPVLIGVRGVPEGFVVKAVRLDGRDITRVPTDFGAGAGSAPLEIVLTDRVARPAVRVLDQNGPATGAYGVIILPADPTTWASTDLFASSFSAREGVVRLEPLLPGDYVMAALPHRDLSLIVRDRRRIAALATIGTRVTFVEGDSRTIDLRLVNLPAAR